MHPAWHSDTPKDKEKVKELLYQNKNVLDKLQQICYSKIKAAEKKRRSGANLQNPNWAYEQADMNGYLRCLYELEELFTLQDKE